MASRGAKAKKYSRTRLPHGPVMETLSDQQKVRFIVEVEKGYSVKEASERLGFPLALILRLRNSDEYFAGGIDRALESTIFDAEQTIIKAIRDGDTKLAQWYLVNKTRFAKDPAHRYTFGDGKVDGALGDKSDSVAALAKSIDAAVSRLSSEDELSIMKSCFGPWRESVDLTCKPDEDLVKNEAESLHPEPPDTNEASKAKRGY